MAKFDFNDDSVVVIIGSGAGGGTLANELCQKGIKVVSLEAGARQSQESFINDEWKSFSQLAWLDARTTSGSWRVAKDFAGLPAWICKTVGGTTTHWAGASLRFQEHEFRTKSVYGNVAGANLLDWPVTLDELAPYYAKAENKMGVTRTNGIPGLPGNNNFKVMQWSKPYGTTNFERCSRFGTVCYVRASTGLYNSSIVRSMGCRIKGRTLSTLINVPDKQRSSLCSCRVIIDFYKHSDVKRHSHAQNRFYDPAVSTSRY
jgi:choline dehydrogenase-like flavoprotein